MSDLLLQAVVVEPRIPRLQPWGVVNLTPERYEVIISDDVSVNEFLERYEIVEKNGLIYTIEEKTE